MSFFLMSMKKVVAGTRELNRNKKLYGECGIKQITDKWN